MSAAASGFRASAALRLALAATWGVLAFGATWAIGARSGKRADSPRPSSALLEPPETANARVEFSATFEPEAWGAALNGRAIPLDAASGAFDVGLSASGSDVLVVEAKSSDFFGEREQAMRLRVLHEGHAHEFSAWGRGDLLVRVDMDEVLDH